MPINSWQNFLISQESMRESQYRSILKVSDQKADQLKARLCFILHFQPVLQLLTAGSNHGYLLTE